MATKKGSIHKSNPAQLNWFKNVAKSLGYTTTELVTSIAPSMGEFISENTDYTKELYNDLRQSKSANKKLSNLFGTTAQMGIAKDALKNAIEDIKSGKIYNKERQEAMYDVDMDDIDLDDSFGMSEFSFDDKGGDKGSTVEVDDASKKNELPSITIKNIQPPISPNNPMVKAVQQQTSATLNAAQANINAQTSIAASQSSMTHRIGTGTLNGLQAVNDNLSLLVNFQNDSMAKYVGASLKYYEDSLKAMSDTLAELKRANNPPEQEKKEKGKDPVDNVFLSYGGLNFKGYVDQVKKNFERQFSENMFLQPIKMMFEDTDTLKSIAASPLSFISTKIVTTLIPQMLQQSMQNLDKSFSSFFPALIMKINKMATSSSNPFIQILGEIFGAASRSKSSVDLSRYNRGQIPFDGETKKSIVEVIPGYLRKILAALDGKEEVAYDLNTGTWKTVSKMKDEFDSLQKMYTLNPFMGTIDTLKQRSEAFQFKNVEDRRKFNEGIEQFFINMSKNGNPVNPFVKRDKDGLSRDEMAETFDFDGNKGMQKIFRELILSLSKSEQIKVLGGKDIISSRKNVRNFMEKAEEDPTLHNANLLFNEMGFDGHMRTDKATKEKKLKKGFGLFNPVDKFNLSSLDYLRSIKTILLQGLRVFPVTDLGNRGPSIRRGQKMRGHNALDPEITNIIERYEKERNYMLDEVRRKKKEENNKKKATNGTVSLTPEEIAALPGQGQVLLENTQDASRMSREDLANRIQAHQDYKKTLPEKDNQKKDITQWLGKFFKGDNQERFNLLREKVNGLLRKPAELLRSVFDKIDNSMYDIVFGVPGEEGHKSFFESTLNRLSEKFEGMGVWIKTKVFEPIKDSLIGEDGIITKMKNSEFFQSLKANTKKFGDWMFGKPDGKGVRRDGLLANTGNNILDMWDAAKYYFTGKGYVNRAGIKFEDNDESVLRQAKTIFKNFSKDLKHYLVGDKKATDEDNKRGVLSGILGGLKQGFVNFKDAIFGPSDRAKKNGETTFKELAESFKKKAPKALAWGTVGAGLGTGVAMAGGMGLLGSIFLPGGPIGAALLGTSLGFLSQSDRFMNWAFGEKNANNERIGGVISKGTQDWFKKNRAYLIGGAMIGALKPILGVGLLPSFLLPGGPIAGALFGVGTAMLVRSEGFQNFMFGEKDADGKRTGGFLSRSYSKIRGKMTNKDGNNLLGNMGAGAIGGAGIAAVIGKMGFLGAMLTPGGLIGGAVLGAAAGIALSSDRWKKALFGEWDDKTGLRKGGLLGKFTNWFGLEVMHPLGNQLKQINLNFQKWFTEKISNPFTDAINPMKQAFKNMTTDLSDFFKKGWDGFKEKIGEVFEKNVGQPFGQFMKEKVMDPLKGFLSKIIMGVGKIFAPIAEAPVKILSSFAQGFRKNQEKRGLNKHIEDGWEEITDFKGRRERGERLGIKGFFKKLNEMYFDKEARDNARFGEHGASYAREDDAKITERNKRQQDKFAKRQAEIDAERERLDKHRKLGLRYDYDNFDDKGRDISRIYNILKSRSGYKHFMKKDGAGDQLQRDIGQHLGVNLMDLLQVKDRDSFNPAVLTKGQKAIIRKALKSGRTGSSLLSLFGIKLPKNETPEKPAGDEVKSSVESMADKVTEAIKNASPIDAIKDTLVPVVRETNNKLSEIASKIGEVLGINSRRFKSKKSGDTSNIPPQDGGERNIVIRSPKHLPKVLKFNRKKNDDDLPSHASGIDNVPHDNYIANLHQGEMVVPAKQANEIREANGQPKEKESTVTGPIDNTNRLVNHMLPSSSMPKNRDGILRRIATDVRTIAREVYGQLDGVGSNIYKMRKLLQQSNGVSDEDLTGSANRDRVGFWGHLKRAIYKPFDFIRDKVTQVVGNVLDKVRKFGGAIVNVAKTVVMIPVDIVKNIGKGLWAATKSIGNMLLSAGKEFVKLPGKLIGVVGSAVEAVGHAVKALGPALGKVVEGAAGLVSGAAKGLGNVLSGVGKGIGSFAHNLGKSLGDVVGVIGTTTVKLVGSVGNLVSTSLQSLVKVGESLLSSAGKLIAGTTKMLVDFSLNTVQAVGNTLKTVGKTILDVVTSPLKFIAGAVGKLFGIDQREVTVKGGHLDSVGEVHIIRDAPTVGTNDYSGIIHAIKEGFHSLLPLPVYVVNEHHDGGNPDGGPSGHHSGGRTPSPGGGGRRPRIGSSIRSAFGRTRAGRAVSAVSNGMRGVRSAISGGLAGGMKASLMGTFKGFINRRKSNINIEDKLTKMNILPGANGNIIPFPQPGKAMGALGSIVNSVFGTMALPNIYGGGLISEKKVDVSGQAPVRDINHETSVREEKSEKAAVAGFRVANIGLLSMIESNTRRAADDLDWIVGWLKKFKFPEQKCCPMIIPPLGGGGSGGFFGGSPGGAGGAATATGSGAGSGAGTNSTGSAGTGGNGGMFIGQPNKEKTKSTPPGTKGGKPIPEVTKPAGPVVAPVIPMSPNDPKKPATPGQKPGTLVPLPNTKPEVEKPAAKGKNGEVIKFEPKTPNTPNEHQQPLPKVAGGDTYYPPVLDDNNKNKPGGNNGPTMSHGGNNSNGSGDNVYRFPGSNNDDGGDYPSSDGGNSRRGGGSGNGGNNGGSDGGDNTPKPKKRGIFDRIKGAFKKTPNNVEKFPTGGKGGKFGAIKNVVGGLLGLFKKSDIPDNVVDMNGKPKGSGKPTKGADVIDMFGGDSSSPKEKGGLLSKLKGMFSKSPKPDNVIEMPNQKPSLFSKLGGMFSRGGGQAAAAGASKAAGGGLIRGALRGAGGLLGSIPGMNLLMGGVGGMMAYNRTGNIFGTEDPTAGQKTAAAIGGTAIGLIPGVSLVDAVTGGSISNVAAKATYGIGTGIGKAYTAITDGTAGKAIAKGTKATGKWISEKSQQAGSAIAKGASAVGGAIATGASNAGQWIGDKAQQAGNAIANSKFGQAVGGAAQGIANGAKSFWNNSAIGGAVNGFRASNEQVMQNFGVKGDPSKVTTGMKVANGMAEGLEKLSGGKFDAEKSIKIIYGIGVTFEEGFKKIKDSVDKMLDPLKKGWDKFSGDMKKIGTEVADRTKKTWDAMSKDASETWDKTKKAASLVGKAISIAAKEKWENLKKDVGDKWDKTKTAVNTVVKLIPGLTKTAWNKTKDKVKDGWEDVKSAAVGVIKLLPKSTQDKLSETGKKLESGWDDVKTTVTLAGNTIKVASGKIWDKIAQSTSEGWENLKEDIGKGIDKMKEKISEGVAALKEPFTDLGGKLKKKAEEALEKLGFGNGVGSYGMGKPKQNAIRNSAQVKQADEDTSEWGAGKVKPTTLNGMTYYSQNDSRWSGKSLTSGAGAPSFGDAGCGPTAAAMVLSSVTGQTVTPTDTLRMAQEGGYVDREKGTSSAMFTDVGSKFGVPIVPYANNPSTLKEDLSKNRPVILRGQGGKAFTNAGHFVVATGLDSKGNVLVNDPISKNRSRAYKAEELLQNTTSSYVAYPELSPYAKQFGAGKIGDKATVEFARGKGTVDAVIAEAKTWLGVPYVFGGTTKRGVDCSGFTQAVFRDAGGINLPRTAAQQATVGVRISDNDIQPGDLVFFANTYKPGISHVGIALGGGKFIGANGNNVNIADYTTGYNKAHYSHARRYNLQGAGSGSSSPAPTTSSDSSSSSGTSAVATAAKALTGAALWLWKQDKATETFETITSNALTGRRDKVDWTIPTEGGDVASSTGSAAESAGSSTPSSGGFNIDGFIPKNTQDAILKKTAELTAMNETNGNYTYGKNDFRAGGGRISPSVGVIQWRGNYVRSMMQQMHQKLPNDPRAAYYANQVNWNNDSPWSTGQQNDLEKYLKDNYAVTKAVQDGMLLNHVRDVNLSQVYKHGVATGKIKNPSSIVMLGEFAQTGPGNVKPFMNSFSGDPNSFPHFVNEFRSGKSFWGRHLGIYNGRVQKDINALSNWSPETGKGFGNETSKEETGFGNKVKAVFGRGPACNIKPSTGFGSRIKNMFGKGLDRAKSLINVFGSGAKDEVKVTKYNGKIIGDQPTFAKGYSPGETETDVPEVTKSAITAIENSASRPTARVTRTKYPESYGKGFTDSYMVQQQTKAIVEGNKDASIIKQALELLGEIAYNTRTTSEGINHLSSKPAFNQVVTSSNDRGNTTVNSNSQYNSNPVLGAMQGSQPSAKSQKDYNTAKAIAGGRI